MLTIIFMVGFGTILGTGGMVAGASLGKKLEKTLGGQEVNNFLKEKSKYLSRK